MSDETTVMFVPPSTSGQPVATFIGRYEIREQIGRGGMATVYKAHDPEIDRTLAIKVLLPDLARSEEYRTRFLREARGAGILSHSNIVTVFDIGEDGQRPYIAMEYVEGGTLADLLEKKERLPVRTVLEMGIQLAKALDYAHKKGIIHRDVKPNNIMLLKNGVTIKVADFGICRIEGTDATRATRVGDVLGTPNYMSPEQVAGQKVDARTDLFSAGVVLYQLLSGALPFEGETFVNVGIKILKNDPVPLDKLRPDLPLSLRRIVDRTLKKQPEKRFQSGEELAQALIAVVNELNEAGRVRERVLPLRIRWSLIMGSIVAVTMTLAGMFLYQRQSAAMLDQAMSYGAALTKFMASQAAVPVLSEDWPQIEVFVQESISRQDFSYLTVVDHQGTIRGSSLETQLGAPYVPTRGERIPYREKNVIVERTQLRNGPPVLDFKTPIVFQGREIGTVHLGLPKTPLDSVTNLTLGLLGALIAVTCLAVVLGAYFLAHRLAEPLRVLKNSLNELARGNYDYRINEKRQDEFGELYQGFDIAASTVARRHAGPQQEPEVDLEAELEAAPETPPAPPAAEPATTQPDLPQR